MAKAYEPEELMNRVFFIVALGIGLQIAVFTLIVLL